MPSRDPHIVLGIRGAVFLSEEENQQDGAKVEAELGKAKIWVDEICNGLKEVGLAPPDTTSKTFVVMGKTFDPAKPEDYIKSFAIKRAA